MLAWELSDKPAEVHVSPIIVRVDGGVAVGALIAARRTLVTASLSAAGMN
ncbi:MAG: hypothetical protein ACE5NW_13645 [Acidiferrobacterales bacterium]